MTVTLGIFDLFTYAIPGSLQLAFFAYIAVRLNLVDFSDLASVPAWALAVAIAIASYLLGQLVFLAGSIMDGISGPARDSHTAWKGIAADVAKHDDREFKFVDPMLLLAQAELHNRDVAIEVSRLRATGLMLRSSAVPISLGALLAVVEVALGHQRVLAACAAVALAVTAIGFLYQSQRLRLWANRKTYQIAYWLDRTPGPASKGDPDEEVAIIDP